MRKKDWLPVFRNSRTGRIACRGLKPGDDRGLALVMVLVLSAISLAIMAALVYMLTASTQVSGIQKRYRTAKEAGRGGADVTFRLLQMRGNPGIPGINFNFAPSFLISDCLTAKLNTSTSSTNWASCLDGDTSLAEVTSLSIDPDNPDTYDMRFDLGISPTQYRVFAKIADTVEGNSGADEGLIKSGVVSSNTGEVAVMSKPYLYTVEVDAENSDNRQERAKYSILYQY